MIWWCKVRRAHVLVPLGLLSLCLLAVVFQDSTVILPSFTVPAGGGTKIVLFAPIPLTAMVALSLDARLPAAETTGARPVRAVDACLHGGTMVAAFVLCAPLGVWLDSAAVVAAARNAVFLLGLLLVAHAFMGQSAVVVPVAWVAAVVLVGFRENDDPYPWAIIPEEIGVAHSALATSALFVIALAVRLRYPRDA